MVSAMGSINCIARTQSDDRPDGATLLADARVSGSMYQAGTGKIQNHLFKGADELQLAEEGAQ
ncbi:hypothetical protein GCM10027417_21300 [Glutamicibacter endophyticus]